MTLDEAAATLGVGRDADERDIDRAFRRLARELHPDRFAGAPDAEVRAAAARFAEVNRAHELLLADIARRADRGAAFVPPAGDVPVVRPAGAASARLLAPFSWKLFAVWVALYLLGAFFASSGGALLSPVDAWVRLALLLAFACATALTGRRWVWSATLALLALSAVATIVSTTVGALLGLGLTGIAVIGLAVQGRVVRLA